jgi:hypothetical protein
MRESVVPRTAEVSFSPLPYLLEGTGLFPVAKFPVLKTQLHCLCMHDDDVTVVCCYSPGNIPGIVLPCIPYPRM